jgi:hypothetical protein
MNFYLGIFNPIRLVISLYFEQEDWKSSDSPSRLQIWKSWLLCFHIDFKTAKNSRMETAGITEVLKSFRFRVSPLFRICNPEP